MNTNKGLDHEKKKKKSRHTKLGNKWPRNPYLTTGTAKKILGIEQGQH